MKTCNNECGNSWCCQIGETFLEWKERWSKDALRVSRFKGFEFFEIPKKLDMKDSNKMIIVMSNSVCSKLKNNKCSLQKNKPRQCSNFPVNKRSYYLTEKCVFFDDKLHYSYEKLVPFKG